MWQSTHSTVKLITPKKWNLNKDHKEMGKRKLKKSFFFFFLFFLPPLLVSFLPLFLPFSLLPLLFL